MSRYQDIAPTNGRNNKIKVIHIYKDFDIYNGLIEEFLLLARMMDPAAYDFRVCVFNYKGSSFGERFQELGGNLDSLHSKWEDNPFIIYRLYKYLKQEKPHIVQTYILKPNLYGRIAALLAGIPVIISTELTLKNQAHSMPSRIRDLFLHPLNAFLNKYTDVVLCASDAIRKQWETTTLSGRVQVLNPYFDPSKLQQPDPRRAKSAVSDNKHWVIGTVGRLSEEKRHIDLLKAFHEVGKVFPEATLLIVGDGDMKDKLITLAAQWNLSHKIRFTGFQRNVCEYLAQMDVFVLPSRTEGFGIAVLEAMATGLPVIATKVGGIPELVVHDETGVLVKPLHHEDLSKAIVDLLSNPERMHIMGQKGKERALSSFSAAQFIHQHESVYKSALAAKGVL